MTEVEISYLITFFLGFVCGGGLGWLLTIPSRGVGQRQIITKVDRQKALIDLSEIRDRAARDQPNRR